MLGVLSLHHVALFASFGEISPVRRLKIYFFAVPKFCVGKKFGGKRRLFVEVTGSESLQGNELLLKYTASSTTVCVSPSVLAGGA